MQTIIKRITVFSIAVMLLLGLGACRPLIDKIVPFDSLDALKDELGGGLLYPGAMPDDFEWDAASYDGYRYDDSKTWEYNINYGNSALGDDEGRHSLEPGGFHIGSVNIRCYEPVHEPPKDQAGYTQSSDYKINEFKTWISNPGPANLLDIEGVQVIYMPHSGKTTGEVPYLYMMAYSYFMSGEILYMVTLNIYAHAEEDYEAFKAYAKEASVSVARSMLE
jgi:hypothetical protein